MVGNGWRSPLSTLRSAQITRLPATAQESETNLDVKRTGLVIALALALASCSATGGNSGNAASNEPPALPGTVAYHRAELSKLGLTSTATAGESVVSARELCESITTVVIAMDIFLATVMVWEGEGVENPEAVAQAQLEMRGQVGFSPDQVIEFRNGIVGEAAAMVNAITSGSGTEKGELWIENEATLGGCYSEWRRIADL